MSLKWLRKYRLTIGKENTVGATNAAQSVIITDSHIEFDVSVTGDSKLNTLDLKIYNLSRSTIAIFDIENVQVTLEVGYGDDPFVVLFKGEKTYMTTAKKGTEIITTVKAAEGSVATKEGQVNSTLPQGAKVKDVINKLISEGMGLKNDIDIRHYFWGTDYFDIKEVINNELKDSEVSTYKERV